MESKIESIHNNKTWELTEFPISLRVIQSGYSRSRKQQMGKWTTKS
jgi:hypothetical protein